MTKPRREMPTAIDYAKPLSPDWRCSRISRYAVANSRLIRLNNLGMPFDHKDCRRDGHSIA